tara:strand:+ start:12637 stop:12945 length:309 start_codon:yes stop_codon:yes gene_type:complete
MKESNLRYLTHMYRVIEELETNIEKVKEQKLKFVEECESRFGGKGFRKTRKEAAEKFKYYLEKNPKCEEKRRLNEMERRLRHLIKELEKQKGHLAERSKEIN